MRNRCARCGKLEILGRAFEQIGATEQKLVLCVECSQLVYKAMDAKRVGDTVIVHDLRNVFINGIRESTQKSDLLQWYGKCLE